LRKAANINNTKVDVLGNVGFTGVLNRTYDEVGREVEAEDAEAVTVNKCGFDRYGSTTTHGVEKRRAWKRIGNSHHCISEGRA